MRFRAEQHLRRQRDIKNVRDQGRRIECGGFTLWYLRRLAESSARKAEDLCASPATFSASAGPSATVPQTISPDLRRVCVIASTAAVGCAVERARAKRRLREVFRLHQLRVPAGHDLLLIARRTLNQLEYREIERKFMDACQRIPSTPP